MENEKYLKLVDSLNQWSYEYYTLDTPSVTDAEYDVFYDQLIQFEKEHPDLIAQNSPSQKVGFEVLDSFTKKEHTLPLYSLGKANELEEIEKFITDTKKANPDCTYSIELKFDGLSIVLRYENGFLTEARTRGNGKIGEIVTEQIKTIRSIPLKIKETSTVEVQGEVYMKISQFNALNEKIKADYIRNKHITGELSETEMDELSSLQFKTARNSAAGSLRNLDTKLTAQRKLDAYLYAVPYISDGISISSQKESFDFLKENKFKVNNHLFFAKTFDEIKEIIEKITEMRDSFDYDIDGIVIKVDDFATREELGFTAKFPKWAIAWKFEAETGITKVTGIKHQTKRTGKISFVADLEPISLGGATFVNATLNNLSWMEENNLMNCLNAEVVLVRSNDVIPKILALHGKEGKRYIPPTHCSSCGSELVNDGVHLYCMNTSECSAQAINATIHFASRNAMNINTLSIKTVELLFKEELISNSIDLYSLKKEDLLNLEGFREVSANKLLKAIKDSLNQPFDNFILALGIRDVGKETATKLCEYFGDIEKLRKASIEELQKVDDVGEKVSIRIFEFFRSHKELIDQYIALGVQTSFKKNTASVISKEIEGKKFVLTGTMPSGDSKSVIQDLIKSHNGIISSSVSKNTDYVIYGDSAGSKYDKALELESKLKRKMLLSEKEFYALLNE